MKKILILTLTCSLLFSQSEKESSSNIIFEPEKKPNWNTKLERFEYSDIVEVEDQNKNEIYFKLVRWATLTYPSVKNVIELKDKESGNIIIRATVSNETLVESNKIKDKFSTIFNFQFPFVLDIRIKDGKYKYELYISEMSLKVTEGNATFGGNSYSPIENFHHNWYYSQDYLDNRSLYDLVDEQIEFLLLYMELFVITESLEEDW